MKQLLLTLVLLLSSTCWAGQLRIAGSTSIEPVMTQIVRLYRQEYPAASIRITAGGTAAGIAALLAGEADIAMSSRFIQAAELQQARRLGIYPVPFQIAHDAIAPVAHARNPLRNLSMAQLRAIYLGEIDNWQQLGGADAPIELICRDQDSGTHATWEQLVLQGQASTACHTTAPSTQAVIRAVRARRNALGYVSLAHLNAHARVRPLQVDQQACTPACVQSGCYPITRSLFLFSNDWPDEQILSFIHFVQHAPAARKAISAAGLIPTH